MAHRDRHRYIEPFLQAAGTFSTIVGIVGQRQVGKTTLLEKMTKSNYSSLDDQDLLSLATEDPKRFLTHQRTDPRLPLGIDECQRAPSLFPALKLAVQNNSRPGQFFLTGSIRFTSRKAIQESLTGRIHTLEMIPMTISEMHRQTLPDFTKFFHYTDQDWKRHNKLRSDFATISSMNKFLDHGGLPGVCFLREKRHRNSRLKSHIETLLQRDIRLIIETTLPYENLRSLLGYFAEQQGLAFNMTEASRATQISPNTLKKIISAFENMFLIRRVIGFGNVVTPRFFLEDQGMATFLSTTTKNNDLIRFSFSHLFAQAHYHHMDTFRVGHYSNRGGADISLVFEIDKIKYGIEISLTEKPNLSILRSAESFLQDFPNGYVIILTAAGEHRLKLDDRVLQIPLWAII